MGFKLLLAALWVLGSAGLNTAEAGTTRAEKQCAKYRAKRETIEETETHGQAEVDAPLLSGKIEGGQARKTEFQELPEDVVRASEELYQNCLLWRDGLLSTKQFNTLVLRQRELQTEKGMRATERRNQRANRRARQDERTRKRSNRRVAESSRHSSSFNQKFKKLLMWTGGTALAGGGAVVYFTSKTAKQTQAEYGPEDEWEDLQRLNTIGWEALAGGAVVFYVGAKLHLHVSAGRPGSGLYLQGAF